VITIPLELLQAIRDSLFDFCDGKPFEDRDMTVLDAVNDLLEEARAALAQPVPDAIHWPQVVAYPGGNGGLGAWVDISTGDGPEHVQRFHAAAHPQPAPLTDTQIDQITAEHWGRGLGALYAAYRAYARAIEQAHGIVPAPATVTTGE
jgi:hypothetical protein